jgi:hypothetical protein
MATETNLRWNSSGQDGQCLQSLIMNGAIPRDMTPSQVQHTFKQFQKYNSNSFATNLRRFRTMYEGKGVGCGGEVATVVPATDNHGKCLKQIVKFNFTLLPYNHCSAIVPRATPSPIRSFPHYAGLSGNLPGDDLAVKMTDLHVGENLSIPSFGSPSVTIASSSTVFGSSPTEMGHFYVAYPWIDGENEERVTIIVTLSSIPVQNYEFSVSPCGLFLKILTRLPSILSDSSEFNNRCFKKNGKPAYVASDFRCVSHSRAVCALRMAMGTVAGGELLIPQSICLPFRCEQVFSSIEGRSGVSIKAFENGMKIAIVELRQFSAVGRTSYCRDLYGAIDDVSLGSCRSVVQPLNFSGRSVVSISYSTGLARPDRFKKEAQMILPTPIVERARMCLDDNNDDEDDDDSAYTEVTEVTAAPTVQSFQSRVRVGESNKRRNLRSLDGSFVRSQKGHRGDERVPNNISTSSIR